MQTAEQKAQAHRAVEVGGRQARTELCRLWRQVRRMQAAGAATGHAVGVGDVGTCGGRCVLTVPVSVDGVEALLSVDYGRITVRIGSCATSARTAPVLLRRILRLRKYVDELAARQAVLMAQARSA